MIRLMTLLVLVSCGTNESKQEKRTEVIVEKSEPVEVVVAGSPGETGKKGKAGENGADGRDGKDAVGCYTQNELARTRWHGDHEDFYYDVLMICPDNVNYIARDVKYHEEL